MHISDVQKFLRCPRLYQFSQKDNTRSFPYFNIDINITESVIRRLALTDYYMGAANESNEDTFKAISQYNWLVNARFVYRGLRVRIPFIYHEDNCYDVYFTSLSATPNTGEASNIVWSLSILKKLQMEIKNIRIIHLNGNYVRGDQLDEQQLWTVSDCFYNGNGNPSAEITKYVGQQKFSVDGAIDALLHFDSDEDFESVRTARCTGRSKCRYYDICFPEEKNLPVDSILRLTGSQYKYEMYNSGIQFLSQADLMKLEGATTQYAQIMADKLGGLYYDHMALKCWLDANTEYPLSFVDFEWDLYAVPPYEGMKPLEVLPFQYSLHVVQEDGSVEHYQYIGEGDCRREFLERLLNDLPDHGKIFAYNAIGAEILRLQTLKEQFTEYEEKVDQVIARVSDLAIPFVKGSIYDLRMTGLYSLKVIQSLISPEYTYSDLDIENGLEAVRIYRLLQKEENQEKKDEYYRELYEYCGLDSYAMVEVYNWMKTLNTGETV